MDEDVGDLWGTKCEVFECEWGLKRKGPVFSM